MARRGAARLGTAWLGKARQGKAIDEGMKATRLVQFQQSRISERSTRHGTAGRGKAGHGKARQGKANTNLSMFLNCSTFIDSRRTNEKVKACCNYLRFTLWT